MNLVKLKGRKLMYRNLLHILYTKNERSEREIKETIPYAIAKKEK